MLKLFYDAACRLAEISLALAAAAALLSFVYLCATVIYRMEVRADVRYDLYKQCVMSGGCCVDKENDCWAKFNEWRK